MSLLVYWACGGLPSGECGKGGHATTEPELGAAQVLLNEGVKVGHGGC